MAFTVRSVFVMVFIVPSFFLLSTVGVVAIIYSFNHFHVIITTMKFAFFLLTKFKIIITAVLVRFKVNYIFPTVVELLTRYGNVSNVGTIGYLIAVHLLLSYFQACVLYFILETSNKKCM